MEFLSPSQHLSDKALGLQRQLQTLLWLREFRYSSPSALGALNGIPGPYNGNLWHFLNRMKRAGLVNDFTNEIAPGLGRLIMAGGNASAFLEQHGFDHDRILTNPVYVRRCKTAYHDLNLQLAIIERRDKIVSVDSESQLQVGSSQIKPDAILMNGAGRKVAYEYEMTRKANLRVYHAFTSHLHAIKAGAYGAVVYLFPRQALADKYQALFNATAWPNTRREQDGTVHQVGAAFDPNTTILPRTNCFMFKVECHLPTI